MFRITSYNVCYAKLLRVWARNLNDTINKYVFYPHVNKSNLFVEGYIATHSGHSKGSTIDLTIVDANTGIPLDMGSPYDFFGEESRITSYNVCYTKLLRMV